MKCNSCGEREAKYKSLGGMEFCHQCAHDLGLGHKHPGIDNAVHCLDGFASKEEIQKHLKEVSELKTPCKYFDMYPNQPKCYRPPFDELMGFGFRVKHLMDFVGNDNELALKELQDMRGILDKVETKIKEISV